MPSTRSGHTGTSREETTSGESSDSTLTTSTEVTLNMGNSDIAPPAPAPASAPVKSSSSRTTKKREKALRIARAKEDLINLQMKLAAARLETLELETHSEDEDSDVADEGSVQRVDTWLIGVQPVEEKKPDPAPTCRNDGHAKKAEDAAVRSTSVDIAELASVITLAARSGPHGRASELPSYDGSHQEWLLFKAAYQETAGSSTQLENIGRLRRALKGRAREAVENLLLFNTDTEEIMKTLESCFGRPDSIALAETDRLRALPHLTDDPRDICIFASRVANVVATIRALKKLHYLFNPEAVKNIIEKLTPILRYRWYDYAAEHDDDTPELEKIARFLSRESERCGAYAQPEPSQPERSAPVKKNRTYNTREIERCSVCNGEGHTIGKCARFIEAPTNQRWDIAKEKKLCFACLRYRTRNHHCRRKRCDIDGCRYWHHELLHNRKKIEEPSTSETVTSTWTTGSTAYLKIVPVHVSGPVGGVDTYALLDDGSSLTLIDEEIARTTGANGPLQPLHIEAIGDRHLSSTSRRVRIELRGPSQRTFNVNARTMKNLKISAQAIANRDLSDCSHLRDIEDALQYRDARPRLLIGQDNWHLLLADEVRRGNRKQPVASRTPLGWVLHGARKHATRRNTHRVNFVTSLDEDRNEQVRDYFAIESLQPKQPQNSLEERATKILDSEVAEIHREANYELRQWTSNSEAVIGTTEENRSNVNIDCSQNSQRALGVTWKPTTDIIGFNLDLARLPAEVLTNKKPASTTYWTDSRTVLTWLKTGSRAYRPFVAHRVAAIEENTSLNDWRWIPTAMNVADDATRDTPSDFDAKHRWFTGPDFLLQDPTEWPLERPTLDVATGEEKVHMLRAVTSLEEAVPDYRRFSRWERLLRSTAQVLQFIDLCRPRMKTYYKRQKKNATKDPDWRNRKIAKPRPQTSAIEKIDNRKYIEIDVGLLERAEELIVKISQRESFSDELINIEKCKSGKLHALAVINIDGILKIKSRINAASDIDIQQRSPAILSGDHHIAKLYIETYIGGCITRESNLRLTSVAIATGSHGSVRSRAQLSTGVSDVAPLDDRRRSHRRGTCRPAD